MRSVNATSKYRARFALRSGLIQGASARVREGGLWQHVRKPTTRDFGLRPLSRLFKTPFIKTGAHAPPPPPPGCVLLDSRRLVPPRCAPLRWHHGPRSPPLLADRSCYTQTHSVVHSLCYKGGVADGGVAFMKLS